jgi:hypothetical protein
MAEGIRRRCRIGLWVYLVAGLCALEMLHAQQIKTEGRTRANIGGLSKTIGDAVQLDGRVVALDAETNSLLVLSTDGKVLSETSNTGAGGAKLGFPVQMAPTSGRELIVLDAQTPRLAYFRLGGDSLQLLSVRRLSKVTGVAGACKLKGRTYVLGQAISSGENSKLLHVLDQDDADIVNSFGEPFGAKTDEFARIFYSSGRMLCLEPEGLLVVASTHYPEVRAYDGRGALKWSTAIEATRRVTYVEVKPGSFRYNYPADGLWDATVSAFQPVDGLIAIQVGRRRGTTPGTRFESIQTFLLNARDGKLVGRQADLPFVKGAGRGLLFSVDAAGSLWLLSHRLES